MSSKVTLTGHFTLLDGTPAVGAVLIRPSRSPILDLGGRTVIAGPQRFTLDEGGRFSADLPPTDDPALGENFTYDVMATMHHTNWQITGLTLPSDMISVDVLDPPAGVVKEYPTRAEWDALTGATVAEMESALDGAETARDTTLEARDVAVVARDDTLTARDTAIEARDTAIEARDATFTARDTTVEARDATLTAKAETIRVAGEAETARDVAVGAATEAETARDETTAALAGKVTGAGMSLRLDTSVGTRVFLDHPGGSTMLYGDTGWRDIGDLVTTGEASPTRPTKIRRINDQIYFTLTRNAVTGGSTMLSLPTGWYTGQGNERIYHMGANGNASLLFRILGTPSGLTGNVQPTTSRIENASLTLNSTWATTLPWPTTLPGTPL